MSKLGCLALRHLFQLGDFFDIHFQKQDISMLDASYDVPYLGDGDRGHLLDVYRLKGNTADSPTIINIHGGGLFAAYKEVSRSFNYRWAKRGYNVVSLSYRRLPDVFVIDQIRDIFVALRYVRDHADEFGLNLHDVFLTGDSAGALLSLFALSIESSEDLQQVFGVQPSDIRFKAANAISIMLDTVRGSILGTIKDNLLCDADKDKPVAQYIQNPSLLIEKATLPPLFLVTSAEDLIRNDTLKYKRLLDTAGVETRLIDEPKGKTHKLVHVFPVKYSAYEESERISGQVSDYFREVLSRETQSQNN